MEHRTEKDHSDVYLLRFVAFSNVILISAQAPLVMISFCNKETAGPRMAESHCVIQI